MPSCRCMEQVQPTAITLDPTFIGRIDRAPAEVIAAERKLAFEVCARALCPLASRRDDGQFTQGLCHAPRPCAGRPARRTIPPNHSSPGSAHEDGLRQADASFGRTPMSSTSVAYERTALTGARCRMVLPSSPEHARQGRRGGRAHGPETQEALKAKIALAADERERKRAADEAGGEAARTALDRFASKRPRTA